MSNATGRALGALESLRHVRGPEAAARKRALLRTLAGPVTGAARVLRLHDVLCFLRAYPDDEKVLAAVERLLSEFDRRPDLGRCRETLHDSGIAGTDLYYRFYYATALWLTRTCPDRLRIDWDAFEDTAGLEAVLMLLLPAQDAMALEGSDATLRDLLGTLKGPDETDGAFLLRRFEALEASREIKEKLFEDCDIPMVVTAGKGAPSRTGSRWEGSRVHFVSSASHASVPWTDIPAPRERLLSERAGRDMVDLGRTQMVTRGRDLYAFMHASPCDVRIYDMGEGLEFACLGLVPAKRYVFETLYVYVALQSGVPIGYTQATTFLGSAEINFNVFDAFRGGQAAHVFRNVLAMVRHSLGCDTFIINTQQLGADNDEALHTGAWWFYYKNGFRPRDPAIEKILRRELRAKARDRDHRSDIGTLRRLGQAPLFLSTGRVRTLTVNNLPTDVVGARVSHSLASRFGADRERGIAVCAREAGERLGVRPPRDGDERMAWEWWAPVVLQMRGVGRWSRAERRAFAEVIRAKGGRRETQYLHRFDAHPRLKRAIVGLLGSA